MSRTVIAQSRQQGSVSLSSSVWKNVADYNPNRQWLSVQNIGAHPVYLYEGPTAPSATDGSVSMYYIPQLTAGGLEYNPWITGDCEAIHVGRIWALCPGNSGSVIVAEF